MYHVHVTHRLMVSFECFEDQYTLHLVSILIRSSWRRGLFNEHENIYTVILWALFIILLFRVSS